MRKMLDEPGRICLVRQVKVKDWKMEYFENDENEDERPDDYEGFIAPSEDEWSEQEKEANAEEISASISGCRGESITSNVEDEEGDASQTGFAEIFEWVSSYLSWPAADSVSPRGGAGYDGLFFALLARMASLASTSSTVEEYRNKSDHSSAFLLRTNGQVWYPLSGEPFIGRLPKGSLVTFRRSTVIRNFFHSWTKVRKAANTIALTALGKTDSPNDYGRYDGMISVADTECDDSPPWEDEDLARYLESMGIPIDEGENIWDTGRAALLGKISRSDEPMLLIGQLRCPFCGPVRPIRVVLRSPSWTWEEMVGRGSEHLCCPDCLGNFDVVWDIVN